ncbi:hypothetical protein SDC9_108033 [bioreactor metagenome]|uniref:Uncharacterized protein n=1 Tax=bioreactor metagenome TaxID=1076179 RepID=A0A645B6Z4_9ZZZZ
MLIEQGVLRQADHRPGLGLPQNRAPGLGWAGHLQYRAQLPLVHPARGAVGAPTAAGEVALVEVLAAKPVVEPDVNE